MSSAGWKLRTLLRTRRFYTDADLIVLYKVRLLSHLEYRTPAIYHATRVVISRPDAVQNRYLRDVGVDDVTALVNFHLAPLPTRRDIAMLGLIHRTISWAKVPVSSLSFSGVTRSILQSWLTHVLL